MKRLLIFALLGPLIGFLVAFAPLVGALYAGIAFVFGLPFAYLLGFIPLLALALMDGWLSGKVGYPPKVVMVTLIGAALSSLLLPFLLVRLDRVHVWTAVDCALMGAFPAAICSLLAGRSPRDWRALKPLLIFAVLGPLLGAGIVGVMMIPIGVLQGGGPDLRSLIGVGIPKAYVTGFVPALLACLTDWLFRRNRYRMLWCALAGMLASIVPMTVFGGFPHSFGILSVVCIGGLSPAVCSWLSTEAESSQQA